MAADFLFFDGEAALKVGVHAAGYRIRDERNPIWSTGDWMNLILLYRPDVYDMHDYDLVFNTDRASAECVASTVLAFMNHRDT